MRLTKEQIKAMADAAEARARGVNDDDDEWQRGFDETCDRAQRELSLEIIEAEVERLALLTPMEYEIERRAVADRLDMRPSVLDALVKAKRPKKAAKKSAPAPNLGELRRAASHIVTHPDILSLFAEQFSKVIAGESVNGKLLYLVATSRLFDKTMHAAIKGTSAGGKSEIRKRVLEFFPPESVVNFTSLSEKSLIYYEGDFAHQILSMGEATATDEQDFQDYLLRELMSEGRIRHSTVQKVGGNDLATITVEKNGPVAFLVTTTKSKLHPENETRMLSLEIDDSQTQTRSVVGKVAEVEGLNHSAAQVDYTPWQDFQRWLELGERQVVVPFAAEMAALIPPVAVRLRRDVGQVLRAIKAHALLHREQRERDDAGQIVADIEHDYAIVRELLNPILAEGSAVAINEAMAETIDAVAKATIGMTEAEGATSKAIAKLLKVNQSPTWRRLSAAQEEGFVVNLEQRRGMPGKYRVVDQKPETSAILPGAAELIGRFTTQCPVPPPESVHTCIRDEIAEISLEDNVCKDVCTPAAYGSAYDKSLNGDENSPAYARMHDFSGDTAATGNLPSVCAHCGQPGAVTEVWFGERQAMLHPACRDDWLGGDL